MRHRSAGSGAWAMPVAMGLLVLVLVHIGVVEGRGAREIDAAGRYVSPGWTDMMDQSGSTLLRNPLAENKLRMGVTTAIGGEGGTPELEPPERRRAEVEKAVGLLVDTARAIRDAGIPCDIVSCGGTGTVMVSPASPASPRSRRGAPSSAT